MIPTPRMRRLLEMLDDNPNDSFLTYALAKEYEKQGEKHQALLLYRRLLDRDPAYLATYYHLGKLYETMGKTTEAIATYRAGMEHATRQGDQHTLQELAGAKLFLEDPED